MGSAGPDAEAERAVGTGAHGCSGSVDLRLFLFVFMFLANSGEGEREHDDWMMEGDVPMCKAFKMQSVY